MPTTITVFKTVVSKLHSPLDDADSATDTMEAVDLERALRGDGAANEVKVSMRTRLGARRGRGL